MATLSWLNQLRPASFRGVRFYVDSLTNRQGQDVLIREYPFQDLPTFQAMGEGAEEFSIRAYVVGDDYMVGRDALANKLRGEGVLIHPTTGFVKCWVKGKFTISENPNAEGGIARFDITFVRSQARRYPHAITNPLLQLLEAITTAIGVISDWFAQVFQIGQTAGYVIDSVRGDIDHLRKQLSIFGSQQSSSYSPDAVFESVADVVLNAVQSDIKNASNSAQNDDKLSRPTASNDLVNILVTIADGGFLPVLSEPRYPTPSRLLEYSLRQRLRILVQAIAVIALMQHLALQLEKRITRLSYHEYHSQAAYVRSAIDKLMQVEDPSAITLQQLLHGLEASYLDTLTQVTRSAGRMTTFTPSDEMPLMVICYQLYGDLRRYDELRANNPHIQHPMFVPAGIPLTVVAA